MTPLQDWRDDYLFLDTANGPVLRRRDGRSAAELVEDGEHITVPMMLMDAAARDSVTQRHKPTYCIDSDSESGRAWLQRGRQLQEAWRNPPVVGMNVAEEQAAHRTHDARDVNDGDHCGTADAWEDACDAREEAWEERGRLIRDAWRMEP